ncbi:MAG TPA: SAM-dependent methyltransferase [Terriglobia bacterium]|nr:SAM-dependent methyltransferase [Terriglobia bacterium]
MNSPTVKFGPGQPSRTSIVVAALRAFGAREPDPAVRNPDWLAERLLTPEDLALIPEHPSSWAVKADYQKGRQSREVAGMSNLMLVRTRFIDDHLRSSLEKGAKQVVILGAGFDTRAYRFQDQLTDKTVIEVDYRSTQELKKRRLESALGAVPSYVRFAEIDFKRDKLLDVLVSAGYRSTEKTFFIWEGVSMYLTETAVRETLRVIASSSVSGSEIVMDFAEQAMINMLNAFPQLPQHEYTTKWGEPWTFGVPDRREAEFFQDCGLRVREILSFFSAEASRRYLTRADGSRLGSVRGGSPKRFSLATIIRLTWRFLTGRSRWYALAALQVP